MNQPHTDAANFVVLIGVHLVVKLLPIATPPPGARRLLWLGVVGLSFLMLILWGWSFKMKFAFFDWSTTAEQTMIERNRETWKTLFRERDETKQNKEALKAELKILLEKLRQMSENSTTTSGLGATTTMTVSSSKEKVLR